MIDFLSALAASGFAQCRAAVTGQGGLLGGLFMAGLVGSLSHCAGMCGPFVLSQVAARLESRPAATMREWHRLAGAALIPYHLGRATTYGLLGVLAAGLAAGLLTGPFLRFAGAALLCLAALLLLGMALPGLKSGAGGAGGYGRLLGRLARPLFADPTGLKGYGLGVMLGFIPCGLLYGALAAAASAGSALSGGLAMLVFTLGTVPSLVTVGLVGHLAGQRWRHQMLRYAPLLLVVNAAILFLLAWRRIA